MFHMYLQIDVHSGNWWEISQGLQELIGMMKNLTQNRQEQRDIQGPGKLDYNTVRAPYPLWNAELQPLSGLLVTDLKLDILG